MTTYCKVNSYKKGLVSTLCTNGYYNRNLYFLFNKICELNITMDVLSRKYILRALIIKKMNDVLENNAADRF